MASEQASLGLLQKANSYRLHNTTENQAAYILLYYILLVRERSALATLIFTSRVCLSVILSVRNFGAKYLENEAR